MVNTNIRVIATGTCCLLHVTFFGGAIMIEERQREKEKERARVGVGGLHCVYYFFCYSIIFVSFVVCESAFCSVFLLHRLRHLLSIHSQRSMLTNLISRPLIYTSIFIYIIILCELLEKTNVCFERECMRHSQSV